MDSHFPENAIITENSISKSVILAIKVVTVKKRITIS